MTTENPNKDTIAICESQPVTALGIRAMLESDPELKFIVAAHSLHAGLDVVSAHQPAIVMVDKAFGLQAVLEWLLKVKESKVSTAAVIWGNTISEPEALRFLQHGAKGIVRKTADLQTVRACLLSVAKGATWMEDSVFGDAARRDRYPRSELTPREQQVMELVEQGLKNKEIGRQLGIRPGTVKIHLKHIFEKTGVRGRYGLALSGFKERVPTSLIAV